MHVPHPRAVVVCLALFCGLAHFIPSAVAKEFSPLADALAAAGENRGELQRVLDHFAGGDDKEKQAAARFLIENMPGKGYIITSLKDAQGKVVSYDPLAYPNYKAALAGLDALEKEHGTLEFDRERKVEDVQTIKAEFLIKHIDQSFAAWQAAPADRRVSFDAFREYILPYRGSQEPLSAWHAPLRKRYEKFAAELAAEMAKQEAGGKRLDVRTLWRRLNKDVGKRVRFNERFYLHPTDQGFGEMLESGQGRCEDITNMQTFAARSMAIATAADYTPYWGHRDNNHAWNVLLDADGRGFSKGNAHAAKVYRKTFRIQREALVFQLPKGREAPNRFMASPNAVDVTDQYAPTTDVSVALDAEAVGTEGFAYLCVFNGGVWKAIQWSRVTKGRATFARMGRGLCYLPAVHDGTRLIPAAPPRIVHKTGAIQILAGQGGASGLAVVADTPKQRSVDTGVVTPVSRLKAGATYTLSRWTGLGKTGWTEVRTDVAAADALAFDGLPQDGLYWLVRKGSRSLERIFTIERGLQKFW